MDLHEGKDYFSRVVPSLLLMKLNFNRCDERLPKSDGSRSLRVVKHSFLTHYGMIIWNDTKLLSTNSNPSSPVCLRAIVMPLMRRVSSNTSVRRCLVIIFVLALNH